MIQELMRGLQKYSSFFALNPQQRKELLQALD